MKNFFKKLLGKRILQPKKSKYRMSLEMLLNNGKEEKIVEVKNEKEPINR